MQGPQAECQQAADAPHGPTLHAHRKPWPRRHWRLILLAAFFGSAIVTAYFTPLGAMLRDREQLARQLSHLGIWLYPIIVIGTAVIVAAGIPRLALCFVGGVLTGFWWGLLLVQLGTLIGDYALFLFVRWGGRNYVQRHWPKLQKMADVFHRQGVMGVILIRQFPIPGTLSNLVLGLSRLRHRHFLLGTAIGIFPEAIPVTLIGAGLMKSSGTAMGAYITGGVAFFALVWIGLTFVFKQLNKTSEGSEIMARVKTIEDEENDG